ncbi:hypothetical protein C0991_005672 [Blastosporella zonata]|nr:hypothetical protein C0991_005672 [Blastosporella zonata]
MTVSSFSPASSSAPMTPPSYPRILPGPMPYSTSFQSKPTRLHALLQSSPSPLLNFDLRQPPSTITSHHKGISLCSFSEPATQPPLSSLTIVVPYLPWTLTVYPSRRGGYVTVEDVFEELYRMLRKNIVAEDYHALPSDKDRRRVSDAYERRYRRIPSSREYEEEKRLGVRRVDFLMGRVNFGGLAPSAEGPDVWVLQTP